MTTTAELPHPMQPIGLDFHGTPRFKANEIVLYLLDEGPFDLNHLAERLVSGGADERPPRVGWTCPALDRLVDRLERIAEVVGGDTELADLVEEVRADNVALRARLAWFETELRRRS